MTLTEFKAWFEGYTENLDGTPNTKQWKRIKSRISKLNGEAITERIFIDRYLPRRYSDYSYPYLTWCVTERADTDASHQPAFQSTTAMAVLGKNDAVLDLEANGG